MRAISPRRNLQGRTRISERKGLQSAKSNTSSHAPGTHCRDFVVFVFDFAVHCPVGSAATPGRNEMSSEGRAARKKKEKQKEIFVRGRKD